MNDNDSRRTAVAWMLFASFSFGSMNALVKWTSAEVDVWTMVFVRSLVIAFAIYIIARIARVDLVVHDRKNMAFRCFTGLAAMILYFSALALIPIGQAVTLQYTNPLFVALLSGFFLSERVHPQVWVLAIVSFLGILLIVSPDLRTIEKNALLALGSGFFAGVAYLYVRRLKATEEALSIVFWFAAFSVVATVLPAIPSLAYVISDPILMLALVGIGVGAGAGQVGLTYAFHRANAAWVSAFSYLTVIVATAYGYLLFNEVLDTRDIIGGIMIICSGIILSLFQVDSTENMDGQE
ncbi:MAG: DMT family transporter [Euryarchaeota archaeon TMED192]|nr:MAG: DMT family transporter [Euryarchaeota archaeon TMED192]|tara:strand:+ start:1810 stop:2694 length:885 start_codon:yes stop_codon:yes gene_type:complete